jgi:hypothetical protein
MHKCTCDWCPAYREDLDAQTKGYDRALAELAEARAENERLRAALGRVFDWVNETRPMCSALCAARVPGGIWGQMQTALARPKED